MNIFNFSSLNSRNKQLLKCIESMKLFLILALKIEIEANKKLFDRF